MEPIDEQELYKHTILLQPTALSLTQHPHFLRMWLVGLVWSNIYQLVYYRPRVLVPKSHVTSLKSSAVLNVHEKQYYDI